MQIENDALEEDADAKESQTFLSTNSSIKTYAQDDLSSVFTDMLTELVPSQIRAGLKEVDNISLVPGYREWLDRCPGSFEAAAKNLGTHGLKLVQPRTPVNAISFPAQNGNTPVKLHYSGNAANGKFAKVLLRPIAIEGWEGEPSFTQRLVSGGRGTELLSKAFSEVFGEEALARVRKAIDARFQRDEIALYHENFPVIFAPGPAGDITLTPLPAMDTFVAMKTLFDNEKRDLRNFREREKEGRKTLGKRPISAPYIRTEISAKIQNSAIGIPRFRTRFFARMTSVMGHEEASVFRFVRGGHFPVWRDENVKKALIEYADDLRKEGSASMPEEFRVALSRRADWIVRQAAIFKDQVMRNVEEILVEESEPEEGRALEDVTSRAPSIRAILRNVMWSNDAEARVSDAIDSGHFRDALKRKGEGE